MLRRTQGNRSAGSCWRYSTSTRRPRRSVCCCFVGEDGLVVRRGGQPGCQTRSMAVDGGLGAGWSDAERKQAPIEGSVPYCLVRLGRDYELRFWARWIASAGMVVAWRTPSRAEGMEARLVGGATEARCSLAPLPYSAFSRSALANNRQTSPIASSLLHQPWNRFTFRSTANLFYSSRFALLADDVQPHPSPADQYQDGPR